MKSTHFFLKFSIPFAFSYWFFDSAVHYFIYSELEFEIIPSNLNELWMRLIIFLLLITFGIFADYHTNKIIKKDIEKNDVYLVMLSASQHILNNFLQSMFLFRDVAGNSKDIDQETLDLYDKTINNTIGQINNLKNIKTPSKETIEERFLPK